MEDLDREFPARVSNSAYRQSAHQIEACLKWLAHFHAKFFNVAADGLWSTGTYWHLDTGPDELQAMQEGKLRESAQWLDQQLSDCPYQTLVHGDAKSRTSVSIRMDRKWPLLIFSMSGEVLEYGM